MLYQKQWSYSKKGIMNDYAYDQFQEMHEETVVPHLIIWTWD